MNKNNSLLGGEGNGGVIYRDCHLGRDSLIGAAVILNLLSNEKKSISEIRNNFPYYFIEKSKIKLPSNNMNISKKLKAYYENEKIIDIDGIKIEFKNDDWVHIRESNTEPIIRIIAETKSQKDTLALIEKIKNILDE